MKRAVPSSFLLLSLLLTGFFVSTANAQEESRKVETMIIPYSAANAERENPEYYLFSSKHIANWILNIRNEIVYDSANPDAKVVLHLQEDRDSEYYFQLAMSGAPSKTMQLAITNEQVGYMKLFENENSWFEDRAISVSHSQNDRLSVANGQRNILDRLRTGPLVLGTVEVYGKNTIDAPDNAVAGQLLFDIVSGNPLDNPVMLVPFVLMAVVAGAVLTLLKVKKRT